MGYTTEFNGVLWFTSELTASQIAYLDSILGEDCRDHPEWGAKNLYALDLRITDDYAGIKWDGTEKTYDMDQLVNVVIRLMCEKWPDFGLRGQLDAQGERAGDVWALVVDGGEARKIKYELRGRKVTCPHCEEEFVLDAERVEVA